MLQAYKDEVQKISVKSATTGLSDVKVVVTKPDGTDVATKLSLAEVGTKAIYNADFTPAEEGTYYLTIESPTDTSIAGQILVVNSKPISKKDIGGIGYDSSTDSLKAMSGKIDSLTANQSSQNNGFMG